MIQLLGVFAVLVGVLAGIGHMLAPSRRPGFFRTAGLLLMAVFVLFAGMWIAGEALVEPGGPAAVGLTASWLVPLLLLVTLALVRPAWAQPVLGVLPVVLMSLEAARFAVASWVAVAIPGTAAGILYLLAARTPARTTDAHEAEATTSRTPVSPRSGPAPPGAAPTRAVERTTP